MVFISYSSSEYEKAVMVKSVLAENGISCWMAPESIGAGLDYSSEIPDAIEACNAFVLILSEMSQKSTWVPKELDFAITLGKPVIPFQIDDEMLTKEFNFRLTNVQRIEAFHNMENSYKKLVDRISKVNDMKLPDSVEKKLPNYYSYYEMLGIKNIANIDIEKIRQGSDVTRSLSVPVGINSAGEIVHLDLHQKGDGPNGLISGPKGSGKSEFIKTLCVSLGLFFSPEDIKIHLIDQKEGDIYRTLEGLPHMGESLCDGQIESVRKFISSIEEEINRRYKLLEENSVSNIYQYLKLRKQSGGTLEKMPHILIIFDELRKFKYEYPDVFIKIREWGNRMNSQLLGIHIFFSTDSVDSVVDDALWKMLDYKICSTLQIGEYYIDPSEDSGSCPGRLYMQSNTRSDVQLMQLAYCGAEDYKASEKYGWFFPEKSQLRELVDLIIRHELD